MKRISIVSFFLCCSAMMLLAQQDTEFWFAAPWMNSHHTGEAEFHVMLSAYDHDARVRISQPANGGREYCDTVIRAHSYLDFTIAPRTDHKQYAETNIEAPYNRVAGRGLYIESDELISAYYQITHANGEAYTLKGRNALGTAFVVMSQTRYPNHADYNGYRSHNNSIQIVATENNTVVSITPSQPVVHDDNSASTTPITVTLNRGETYAVKASQTTGSGHLLGTKIESTHPIAVTTSDDSVEAGNGQDAVGEQLVPTDLAGTDYTILPGTGNYESYYVLALEANTQIALSDQSGTRNEVLTGALDTYSSLVTRPTYIHSDKPVQVFQFTCQNGESGGTVLPSMFCTGSQHVTYKRIPNSDYTMLNILTPRSGVGYVSINGNEIDSTQFSLVPGTNGEWAYIRVDVTSKPASMPLEVESSRGVFQLGVTDHASIPQGSLTYGFFSDYNPASHISLYAGGLAVGDSYTVGEGEGMILIAGSAAGVGHFRWYKNGELIAEGDSLVLTDVALESAGEYTVTGESNICAVEDLVWQLEVTPKPAPPCPTASIRYDADVCADDGLLRVRLTTDGGRMASAEVLFTAEGHAAGLRDTLIDAPEGSIDIVLPDTLYANSYTATLRMLPEGDDCEVLEWPLEFTVQYSTAVLMQRWNDVLSVCNEKYNRGAGRAGYKFVGFQWHKNGQLLSGETGSYYYVGPDNELDFDAVYYVLLTREDGVVIRSCDFQPVRKEVSDL